jgi:hypothetical protein
MSKARQNGQVRDPERHLDDTEERQSQQQASAAAVKTAAREHRENRDKFVEELRDLGINGEDAEQIADEFGIETAGVYALANEDEDDYRRHKYLNRNKRERRRASRSPGWLAERHPEFIALARGEARRPDSGATKPMTQRERQKLHETFEAKTALHSLGKDGEGLSAVSEITAVTEHRRQTDAEEQDDSGGVVSRVFR